MYFALAVLLTAQSPPSVASSDSAHIVLVATTDVHGRVLAWDYVRDRVAPGGLSRATAILETLRAQYPDQVVVVDAGDLLQGNLDAVIANLSVLRQPVSAPADERFQREPR